MSATTIGSGSARTYARAFGLDLDLGFALPGLRSVDRRDGTVRVDLCTRADLDAFWGDSEGVVPLWETRFPDGEIVRVARRPDGAQTIEFGSVATFALTPAGGTILCAPADGRDVRWQRFLLDTVFWWTASTRGMFLLHASALRGRGVIAVASVTGGGKTTLALELLRGGWELVSDDVLALDVRGAEIAAHAGPGLLNAPAPAPELTDLGRPVATIGDEVWLEVAQGRTEPSPLAAIVLYRRGEGAAVSLERLDATPVDLAPQLWDAMDDPGRARERFRFLGMLVDTVPIYRLAAPFEAPPHAIAGELVRQLG